AWRIWPGDIPKTLEWRPTTEIDVTDTEHEICSHALVDRSNGSRVRAIRASAYWPAAAVRPSVREGCNGPTPASRSFARGCGVRRKPVATTKFVRRHFCQAFHVRPATIERLRNLASAQIERGLA